MSAIKDKLAKGMQKSKDAVTGTPAIKIKIREATSNKSWGPTGQQLQELARCSFHYSSFGIIMHKIWKRLNDHGKNWRHIYKALLVLDYLIKNGSKQVIVDARQHLPNIQTLTTYQHIDTSDNDVGQSVRERSRAIIELLNDPERLAEEREKAKHNRGKYTDSMGSEVSRRATRSRDEDGGFSHDDFESKGDDYRGGRGASPSYAKRGGVNSPRPGRKDSDEDEDIPKPEPLPQEWLADSQENMSITYNTDREAKPHKSPVPRSKPRKAQATPGQTPPDLRDKAEQLKEMFVGLTTEDAIKILRKCGYSISDAALRLSDPHRMSKYTGQQQQQQRQQQEAKEQRKPRAPTLGSTNTAPGAGGSLLTDPVVGMQNLSISAQGSGSFAPAFYGSGVGLSQAQPQQQQQQPAQIQAYPYAQPAALQQHSSFVAQPASAGSPYASMPRTQPQQQQQQPPLSGSFSPAPLGSAPSGSAQTQSWTSFGAGAPGLYGSSASASVASSNSSIAAASPQQQPQAAYFAQQQQQLQQQQLQLQQQQQQLQQQIQQQQLQLQQQQQQKQMQIQQQQAAQPSLSSGGGAFQPLQYPQQGTTSQPVFTATPQPYGSSSAAAVSYATPGSPLQYPQSPQLQQQQQQQLALQQQLYQQALASQSSQLAQSPWAGQQAPVAAAPQSSGLYGSSSFQPSQSLPQQQQQQTSTDAFASLVAQQLPKGAQLQSLSPTTPHHQPEPKKTLAQLQSYPAYFQAGQQLPAAPQQVGNGQNPFGQQDFF